MKRELSLVNIVTIIRKKNLDCAGYRDYGNVFGWCCELSIHGAEI